MTMTKSDVVMKINAELGISRKECDNIVESFFAIIKDELCQGNDVLISSFGKWKAKAKKERRGRNPQTGDVLTIDARRVVTFKPSNVLRDTINTKK